MRWFEALALAALLALAWAYLLWMGWGMAHMDIGAHMLLMPAMTNWRALDLLLVFAMWAVMMLAMMLPSALPMLLAYRTIASRRVQPRAALWLFVAGYVAIWIGFSALATLLQWALLEARLLSPMMVSQSALLAAVLLLGAGIYQLTPWKRRCLARCVTPLDFIISEWRDGAGGAWRMGLRHGLFCVGCCWLLMLLLFVLGVMNVLWIAALSAVVLLEKFGTTLRWWSPALALTLLLWGGAVAFTALA